MSTFHNKWWKYDTSIGDEIPGFNKETSIIGFTFQPLRAIFVSNAKATGDDDGTYWSTTYAKWEALTGTVADAGSKINFVSDVSGTWAYSQKNIARQGLPYHRLC